MRMGSLIRGARPGWGAGRRAAGHPGESELNSAAVPVGKDDNLRRGRTRWAGGQLPDVNVSCIRGSPLLLPNRCASVLQLGSGPQMCVLRLPSLIAPSHCPTSMCGTIGTLWGWWWVVPYAVPSGTLVITDVSCEVGRIWDGRPTGRPIDLSGTGGGTATRRLSCDCPKITSPCTLDRIGNHGRMTLLVARYVISSSAVCTRSKRVSRRVRGRRRRNITLLRSTLAA